MAVKPKHILLMAVAGAAFALTTGPASAESLVERGAYLMRSIVACGNCHTPQTPEGPDRTRELAGGVIIDEPGLFRVVTPNITPHARTGIGSWTDAEIERAITDGLGRDGRRLMPPMGFAYYREIGPGDLDAIVTYLRSLPPK